jgi:hypothetical protein
MRRVNNTVGIRALAGAMLLTAAASPAAADFKVFMPDAEPGELEFEPLGDYGLDRNNAHSHEASFVEEFEYGVTNFWKTGLELEQDRDAGSGQSVRFSQLTWENILQFTERGQHWLDAGFFFEFGKTTLSGEPNEVTFGPIFRKELFGTINTVNLFIEKDIGTNAAGAMNFLYNWETRLALGTPIEPGFQAYGRPSGFEGFTSRWPQDNRIGPQLFGEILHLGPGDLKWNAGILFGVSSAAPRETIRWQAEYEIHF